MAGTMIRVLLAPFSVTVAAFCLYGVPSGRGQVTGGFILGQVVDANTGRGVSDAVVSLGEPTERPPLAELVDLGAPSLFRGTPRRVLTNTAGHFVIRGLPKGRFALTAEAPGYLRGQFGQGRPLGPGVTIDLGLDLKLAGLRIQVWKAAAISGLVTDETGEPVAGVLVQAFRRVFAGGQPRFNGIGSALTNDIGVYRITDLPPGDYAVGITASQETMPVSVVNEYIEVAQTGARSSSEAYRNMKSSAAREIGSADGLRIGDFVLRQGNANLPRPGPMPDSRILSYASTFHVAASAPSRANIITLRSGERRENVDVRITALPTVRIDGHVRGPSDAGSFLAITLVPPYAGDFQSESAAVAATTVSDSSGAFTFLGVSPGSYVLKVRKYPALSAPAGRGGSSPPRLPVPEPTAWAALPVNVIDRDLRDLVVTLQPGLSVGGRVEFVGSRSAPSEVEISQIQIRLQSADGRTSSPTSMPGRVESDGTFRSAGYAAGKYIVTVLANSAPSGWTLQSVMLSGRDVSVEPFEIFNTDISGALMTFTDQLTTLSGSVFGPNGPEANAEVLIFPADSLAWQEIGVPARRGRSVRVTPNGTFVISGLPLGDYFVVAVDSTSVTDWRDPLVLGRLVPMATRVKIADSQSVAVTVSVRRQ